MSTLSYTGLLGHNYIYANATEILHIDKISDNTYLKRIGTSIRGIVHEYDAIVDSGGAGDYTLLSSAINEGHKSIFIMDGVYNEPNQIIIPNNARIIGQSIENTIINFGSNVGGLLIDSGATAYKSGTISFETDSSIVTGIETEWMTITPGQVLSTPEGVFEILSVTSDTSLTIAEIWKGNNVSNVNYFIVTPRSFILSNFTIERVITNDAITVYGGIDSIINNIKIRNSTGKGIITKFCNNISIKKCHISDISSSGISLRGTYNSKVSDCHVRNTTESCLEFLSELSVLSENLIASAVCGNGARLNGINIGGAIYSSMHNCRFSYNARSGIKIDLSTTENINIKGCQCNNNGVHGIEIPQTNNNKIIISNCQVNNNALIGISTQSNSEIINCHACDNGDVGILVNGSNVIISGCIIKSNINEGIKINGFGCNCNNNMIISNGLDGILLTANANESIINNNFSGSNGDCGIEVKSGCTNTIITSNRILNNSAGGILNYDISTITNNNV